MKPFDLEAAKRGEPIVTRNGRKAKFIGHVPEAVNVCKVVVFVDGDTHCASYAEDGSYINDHETDCDLFMYTPPMRSINGYSYPEPVREPLKFDQKYFIASPLGYDFFSESVWSNSWFDFIWLKRGLIQLTSEGAQAQGRAIILASGGEL